MKVLQVFNRYIERGGEEDSVERVSNVISAHHQVFHSYFDSASWLDEQRHSVSCIARIFTLINHAMRMLYNPSSVKRFKAQLNVSKPDIILIHNIFPVGSIGIYLAAIRSGIPVLHYVHNFRPFSVNGYLWANGRLETAGLRKNFFPEILAGAWQNSRIKTALYACVIWITHALGIYRKMDGWLAVSRFMQQTFISAGVPEDKVFLLMHSWASSRVDTHAANIQEHSSTPYFLFLGRITEAKGIKILLKAWQQVEAEHSDTRLIICGEGPEVEWLALELPKFKSIEYRGFVTGDEKAQLLAGCRALLVPSEWWEPLGLVVYEAYQCHRPVITAGSGGLLETVVNGETGWQYPPCDVEALSACILSAIRDPDEASIRGEAGFKWLMDHTRHSSWLDDFEKIAETVISRGKLSHQSTME